MTDDLRIAAVFATMNRAATAVACVHALAKQTRPPDLVVVADNVSSDDTVVRLEAMTDVPFDCLVHRLSENRGNAGGVQEAMDLAFAKGANAVWILDDDSWPHKEALEVMLAKPWDETVVRHPLQIDPKTGRFTWPLQVVDVNGEWKMVDTIDSLPPGDFIRSRITWTGALLPKHVRDAVGPVNGELFIRGEDEEYPWRIEQAGFKQEAVRHSLMDHPGPEGIVQWTFLGRNLFFERNLADWKLHYKVRNMVWLKRLQSGGLHALAMAAAYTLATAWIDGAQRLPLVLRAAADGWSGRLGKWAGH